MDATTREPQATHEENSPDRSTNHPNESVETLLNPIFHGHQRGQLPPELVDAIIDELHDDQATLATCALVCKSWVPASRRHLFFRVTIDRHNLSDASHLLSSTSCARAVRHLCLRSVNPFRLDVCEITSKLPHITHLRLISLKIVDGPMGVFPPPALAPIMRNLESLALYRVHFLRPDHLHSLQFHCPRLRNASFFNTDVFTGFTVEEPLSRDAGALLPGLRSLEVVVNPPFFEWLVRNWESAGSFPSLVTLQLNFWSYRRFEASTERLLEVVGPLLQKLSFSAPPTHGDVPARVARCFSFLTQLRYLTFDLSPSEDKNNSRVRLVLEALRHLPSPHLHSLTLILALGQNSSSGDSDTWSELDMLIDSPRFSCTLRRLVIKFWFWGSETWIAETLRLSAARGILQICYMGL